MEYSRRMLFRVGGAATLLGLAFPRRASGQEIPPPVPAPTVFPFESRSPVSLIKGESRRKNVTDALVAVDREIAPVLQRKKYVAIKVNNVTLSNQLAATHVDALRGILDYLEPRFKGPVLIVESAVNDSLQGFEAYRYAQLIPEYKSLNLQLVDLNREGKYEVFGIIDRNIRPIPVRLAARLLDQDAFIISSAMLKTHNAVIATMTVKNVAMGAPLHTAAGQTPSWNDKGLMHAFNRMGGRGGAGRGGRGGPLPGGMPGAAPPAPVPGAPQGGAGGAAQPGRGARPATTGAEFHAINYNIATVAKRLSSAWCCAVIDGFEGMEGNGPSNGSMVPTHVALASPDPIAADRVGLEVMGIPHHAVGYLQYAGQLGAGQYDIAKIDIRGEKPEAVQHRFKLNPNAQQHLDWLNDIVRQG